MTTLDEVFTTTHSHRHKITPRSEDSDRRYTSRASPMSSSLSASASFSASSVAVFIGNSLHVVNLLNLALYGLALYQYAAADAAEVTVDGGNIFPSSDMDRRRWNGIILFDEQWLESGFCMPHDVVVDDDDHNNYYTTHDLSGHLMIGASLIGLVLLQNFAPLSSQYRQPNEGHNNDIKKDNDLKKAYQLTFWALIGSIGHGLGHYLIAHARRNGYYPPSKETFMDDLLQTDSLWMAALKAVPGLPLFWVPLTRTYMLNTTSKVSVGTVSFIFWFGSLFNQTRFGFSYAQAVLFGGSSIDQLLLPRAEKDCFEFALWPLLTTIPNGLFAWYESSTCTSSTLMRQHGHLIYDGYMVSSYIVFYCMCCWVRRTSDKLSLKINHQSEMKTSMKKLV